MSFNCKLNNTPEIEFILYYSSIITWDYSFLNPTMSLLFIAAQLQYIQPAVADGVMSL